MPSSILKYSSYNPSLSIWHNHVLRLLPGALLMLAFTPFFIVANAEKEQALIRYPPHPLYLPSKRQWEKKMDLFRDCIFSFSSHESGGSDDNGSLNRDEYAHYAFTAATIEILLLAHKRNDWDLLELYSAMVEQDEEGKQFFRQEYYHLLPTFSVLPHHTSASFVRQVCKYRPENDASFDHLCGDEQQPRSSNSSSSSVDHEENEDEEEGFDIIKDIPPSVRIEFQNVPSRKRERVVRKLCRAIDADFDDIVSNAIDFYQTHKLLSSAIATSSISDDKDAPKLKDKPKRTSRTSDDSDKPRFTRPAKPTANTEGKERYKITEEGLIWMAVSVSLIIAPCFATRRLDGRNGHRGPRDEGEVVFTQAREGELEAQHESPLEHREFILAKLRHHSSEIKPFCGLESNSSNNDVSSIGNNGNGCGCGCNAAHLIKKSDLHNNVEGNAIESFDEMVSLPLYMDIQQDIFETSTSSSRQQQQEEQQPLSVQDSPTQVESPDQNCNSNDDSETKKNVVATTPSVFNNDHVGQHDRHRNLVTNNCAICLEEYNDSEIISWSSKNSSNGCQHAFHQECIANWLVAKTTRRQENDLYTCPCCRQIFID